MKVHVRGAKKAGLSVAQLKRAVGFYADRLGISSRLQSKITIFLKIETESFGYSGLCYWYDDPVRPKEFEIQILKEGLHETLSTLAHEMVHLKQYATGQMRDLLTVKNTVVWNGKRSRVINSGDGYEDQPWEKEAYSLEKGMKNAFVYHEKKHGRW